MSEHSGIMQATGSSTGDHGKPAGHWQDHEHCKTVAEQLIRRYRRRCGLEDIWQVEILVSCPSELQQVEASIGWDAEVWYAHLFLRCVLPPALLEWVVVHELCELQRWRSATCFLEVHQLLLPGEQSDRLLAQFRQQRNQEIELQVAALLGHRRPAHLLEIV